MYSKIFCWPNYKDERAKSFFYCASRNKKDFPFTEDFAIARCEGNDGAQVVYIFIDTSCSVEVWKRLKAFLNKSGCPQAQEKEDALWISDFDVATIGKNVVPGGLGIESGFYRRGEHWGGW
jgi:hypothetical protein